MVFSRAADPGSSLAPCVTKPMVSTPDGNLIAHGGGPTGAKQWILKAQFGWAQGRKLGATSEGD
jgi:hypothetical protein